MLGGIGQLYSLTRNETLLDVADSIFEALRRTHTPPLPLLVARELPA